MHILSFLQAGYAEFPMIVVFFCIWDGMNLYQKPSTRKAFNGIQNKIRFIP